MLTAFVIMLSACSSKDDSQPEVKGTIYLNFKYDNNMAGVDEFAKEVSSVAVWAFNKSGKLIWSHSENLGTATAEDFSLSADLPIGEYDFVTWCGLNSEIPLLPTSAPNSISNLSLTLPIVANQCNTNLPPIFNAYAQNIKITEEKSSTLTFNLTRVTKELRVMLQIFGEKIEAEDLDFSIINAPNALEWDMTLKSTAKFDYAPYNVTDGSISMETSTSEEEEYNSCVIADFSTLCFDEDRAPSLIVKRNSDGKTIINISLVAYILQAKSFEDGSLSDQEYLNRQSNYTLPFFIDSNKIK